MNGARSATTSLVGQGHTGLEPVAALVQACTRDFHTAVIQIRLDEMTDAINRTAEAIKSRE